MEIPEKALIYGDKITELIPQRDPFVFIDSFYGEIDGMYVSGFTPKDGFFVEDNFLCEPGLIENMAQSAAAAKGWSCRERGVEVPLGFIGAVTGFELFNLPRSEKEIITKVKFTGEYAGISLAEAESCQEGAIIAKCEFRIFIGNEIQI